MKAILRIGFLALVVLPVPAFPAFAYDDPAIAVCEFTKTRGKPVDESLYKRISAKIVGRTVTIEYERSPLNTAPQSFTYA